MYSDSIFPVLILRIRTYQPCKYEGMGMHSVDTLICRSVKCPILKGFIKRDLHYRYRAEPFSEVLHSAAITMSEIQSQRDVKAENVLKFEKYFDLRRGL